MYNEHSLIQKVRFYTNTTTLYLLTLVFAWYIIQPLHFIAQSHNVAINQIQQKPHLPAVSKIIIISGKPVRIVIPSEGIDLPVDEGLYNSADNSWTLSGYHAQFAMVSTLANNLGGSTFIYGHNNRFVFGPLRHVTPAVGAIAEIYTDNGHIFSYTFQKVNSVGPDDTSVLSYEGPPILTIQTCTGSLSEWRTMFTFSFNKVIK